MVFNKAKQAVAAKEEQLKGKKWLEEVQDKETGKWKDLEGWANVYEPKKEKKEKSEHQKKMQAKALDKAIETAFDKMNTIFSGKILNMLLEVSSTVVGNVADKLSTAPTSNEHKDELVKVFDSSNAILLSYRFEKANSETKFQFFRKEACEELTTVVQNFLANKGTRSQLSLNIRELLEQQKGTIRTLLLGKIDNLLQIANAEMTNKMGEVEGKIDEMKIKADEGVEVINTVSGGKVSIPDDPNINKDEIKSQVLTKKDDMVLNFGAMIKDFLLSKMEQVDMILLSYIEKIIDGIEMAMKLHGKVLNAKDKEHDELKAEMLTLVDKNFTDGKERVKKEVQNVLDMVKGMIDNQQEQQ